MLENNVCTYTTLYSKSSFSYTTYRVPLQFVDKHHCLGILIDSELSWTPHINSLCSKASRLLGFLLNASLLSPTSKGTCLLTNCFTIYRILLFYLGPTPANTNTQVKDDTTLCGIFCFEQTLEKKL